jgi:hypothetical protein
MVDLHVHSCCSDGTFSPKELVEYALTHNISAFALTDHDTTDGLDEAAVHAAALSGRVCKENPEGKTVELIPGIEFSTEYEGQDIHIVGLYIDYHSPVFVSQIQDFISSRENRNEKMCALLREHGISITCDELKKAFPGAVITRAHYGRFLLEKGYVKSISEAFDRYLGDHASCFVPREKVTPMQAVSLIRKVGGIPVLAHPILYHMSLSKLRELTCKLKEAGLLAIEALYSTYSPAEERKIRTLAGETDLLLSGGSDFHGTNKPGLQFGTGYGNLCIPEDVLITLKKALPGN